MVRCTGRQVRRVDNQPVGATCTAVYPGDPESARVIGWRVGPQGPDGDRPAMCPGCARPGVGDDNETTTPGRDILEPLPGL